MGQETLTGTIIEGRYRVTGYSHPTRMGDLYIARRLSDDARVFVKVLDRKLLQDDEARQRFEREIDVLSQIRHPTVVEVLDRGQHDGGLPWLVTEYVEGDSLSDLLEEQGALPPARAAWIAGQIALALAAAHQLEIIHRDLQPDNVLIADPGGQDVVKVVDFGLSRIVQNDDAALTTAGVRLGTPYYMAPEYVRDYELDHRADLYSLGAMLYHLLIGRPPYEGRPYKVLDQHITGPIPSPASDRPDVPPWLDALVQHLMAKEPKDRPQTGSEVVQAIEAGLGRSLTQKLSVISEPQRFAEDPTEEIAVGGLTDPILERIIEEHTQDVQTTRASLPDPAKCLVVERVSRTSIAGRIGVQAGDLLVLPGEPVEGLRSAALHHPVVDRRTYRFHRPSGTAITLKTSGIPIGITALRHPVHIQKGYHHSRPEADALLDLWKQKAWPLLERLAHKTLTQPRGALEGGLLGRFLRKETLRLENHPALVLYGAALIEQGKVAEGIAYVQRFKADYATHWPPVFNAVAHFYLGRVKDSPKTRQLAVDLLVQSWKLHALERTAEQLEAWTGERPTQPSWEGRAFPDYLLDPVDGGRACSLKRILSRLDEAQLFVICMMGGYRGSIDYDRFVHRYTAWTGWFPDVFVGLHVITTQTRRPDDRPEWFKGEDLLRQTGAHLRVLADERAFVQREVKPTALPTAYVLDRERTVVHQGRLESPDVWDAMTYAGLRRMARLRGR